MNKELPMLSVNGFVTGNCKNCQGCINVVQFNCGHLFCNHCLCEHFSIIINNIYRVVSEKHEMLNGKFTYLGCPLECKEARQSIPLHWLIEQFNNYHKYKTVAIHALNFQSFLSGIPTYFKLCQARTHLFIHVDPEATCNCLSNNNAE